MKVKPIFWQDDAVMILDQRLLPWQIKYLKCTKVYQVAMAIKNMAIRGAPAIGIAAAMGVALGVQGLKSKRGLEKNLRRFCDLIAQSRPTARNLFWALERMKKIFESNKEKSLEELKEILADARIDSFDPAVEIGTMEAAARGF